MPLMVTIQPWSLAIMQVHANSWKMKALEVGLNPGLSKHRLQSSSFIHYAMTPYFWWNIFLRKAEFDHRTAFEAPISWPKYPTYIGLLDPIITSYKLTTNLCSYLPEYSQNLVHNTYKTSDATFNSTNEKFYAGWS